MNKTEFNSFFKVHSQNVDNANSLGFWELTDQIIETILLENIENRKNLTVVDFGGGTGRWLLKLDKHFSNSHFILVDLSKDMLKQAKKKIDSNLYKNSISLIESDISSIKALENGIADYIISTYNPLSFCDKPQPVIKEAFRILKNGGKAMITIQGYHNALFSKVNNFLAESDELLDIYKNKKVRWNKDVPPLWQLGKSDMEDMFRKAGFSKIHSRGIACITQPQFEDFDPKNKQLGSLSKKLSEDVKFFNTVKKIELEVSTDQSVINRAMNIMSIGTKK